MKIYGIVVTAGLSSRMGLNKALLYYEGNTFINNIIKKMGSVCSETYIVVGHKKAEIQKSIFSFLKYYKINSKLIFVENPDYQKGMFSSLKKGLTEIKDSDWILYHFVDQPSIPSNFYKEFISQIEDNYDWIQPSFKGKKGHPILFNKQVANLVLEADEESNLKEISQLDSVKEKVWECDYESILEDIDTIDKYNKLKNKPL